MLTVLAYGRTDLVSWHSGDRIVQRLDLFEHGLARSDHGWNYQLGRGSPSKPLTYSLSCLSYDEESMRRLIIAVALSTPS
jgi:hypothetical protein